MALGFHAPGRLTAEDVPALEYYSDGPLQVAPVLGTPASNQLDSVCAPAGTPPETTHGTASAIVLTSPPQ